MGWIVGALDTGTSTPFQVVTNRVRLGLVGAAAVGGAVAL